jgi:hypothetical protein
MLNGYLDWPAVGQVFRIERTRVVGGVSTAETSYGITSLTREQADAGRLLGLVRAHWGVENGLHHVKDETLGEDRCRVRKGAGAEILAGLRNAAVYLLGKVKSPINGKPLSKAAATRRLAARPKEALHLVLNPNPN